MKSLTALLLCIACLASCAPLRPQAKAPRGSVDHVVLIWLKRPGNAADRQKLAAACDELRAIPGLSRLDAGHALPSQRPVVDDSFDLGAVMTFPSPQALDAYLAHPVHVRNVNEVLKPLSQRLVVYDIAH